MIHCYACTREVTPYYQTREDPGGYEYDDLIGYDCAVHGFMAPEVAVYVEEPWPESVPAVDREKDADPFEFSLETAGGEQHEMPIV